MFYVIAELVDDRMLNMGYRLYDIRNNTIRNLGLNETKLICNSIINSEDIIKGHLTKVNNEDSNSRYNVFTGINKKNQGVYISPDGYIIYKDNEDSLGVSKIALEEDIRISRYKSKDRLMGGKSRNLQIGKMGNNIAICGVSAPSCVRKVVIPSIVDIIEVQGLSGCGISEIQIPKNVNVVKSFAFSFNTLLKRVEFCGNKGTVDIGNYCFSNCYELEEVDLKGVKSIGSECFNFCNSLKRVIMYDGLESIGDYAFKDSGIQEVVIPKSVKHIGNDIFNRCRRIKKIKASRDIIYKIRLDMRLDRRIEVEFEEY